MKLLACVLLLALALPAAAADKPADLAKTYAAGVRKVNEAHVGKPGTTTEGALAAKLPKKAARALDALLAAPPDADALLAAGEASLDLDLMDDFARIRARVAEVAPERVDELGVAVSRDRFLLRGVGGLGVEYVESFAVVLDAVLAGYDEVFAFGEWSKVPGKKLRVRLRLVPKITRPPHFAPQFPFHSEIDFPVADPASFSSPTKDGKFLFYGICHELGHVIAMWGDRGRQEDHHAWAHYTGVVIVEHLAKTRRKKPWMKLLRDVRWRSPDVDRAALEKTDTKPSVEDRDGVLALLYALHDAVGPAAIGAALNHADSKGKCLRRNHVRFHSFDGLRDALLATLKSKKQKKAVKRLLP